MSNITEYTSSGALSQVCFRNVMQTKWVTARNKVKRGDKKLGDEKTEKKCNHEDWLTD
jgi:hypothetical protein